ncbi:MAG: hypothetical protein CBC48_17340 [bacterium TMED88]|nr:MAG: hypothetical protein CBC48_17340 [bacterium TMED88]
MIRATGANVGAGSDPRLRRLALSLEEDEGDEPESVIPEFQERAIHSPEGGNSEEVIKLLDTHASNEQHQGRVVGVPPED